MTFKTQHLPGPRSVERGRCRDYPWMIVDPEIGQIGRMMTEADAIRAANADMLVQALGATLTLITKHGLAKELAEKEDMDFARLKKARGAYEKIMLDLANRKGGEGHED